MIKYIVGDATQPIKKPALIAHCCNDIPAWGSGFVLAVNKAFGLEPKESYMKFVNGGAELGDTDFIHVDSGICIANIIGQRGVRSATNPTPINYVALMWGLRECSYFLEDNHGWSLHLPRLGAGLAGGDWVHIENLIQEATYRLEVYVYTLENEIDRFPTPEAGYFNPDGTPYQAVEAG